MGMLMAWLYVIAFGIIGVSVRFLIESNFISGRSSFPWHTFLINVGGCFLAGLFFKTESAGVPLRVGLLIGPCGGFTTFSALSMQTFQLIQSGANSISNSLC